MKKYIVFAPSRSTATRSHNEWEIAVNEAKRIAKKENCEVEIYEFCASCKPAEIPVVFELKEGFTP